MRMFAQLGDFAGLFQGSLDAGLVGRRHVPFAFTIGALPVVGAEAGAGALAAGAAALGAAGGDAAAVVVLLFAPI